MPDLPRVKVPDPKWDWYTAEESEAICSRLAQRDAPAAAIQLLAGHQSIATTERYMHLGPSVVMEAVALLDERGRGSRRQGIGIQVDSEPLKSDPTGT